MEINRGALIQAANAVRAVRETRPLVDCITNRVTINDCANVILACGGSPVMAEDEREIEDFLDIAQGLVLNGGIVSEYMVDAMFAAGREARERNVPVIFDPVGAGASKLRDELAANMLSNVKPEVIRGNMSEIKSVAGVKANTRGVDAAADDACTLENIAPSGEIVRDFAHRQGCVVCATGEIDIVSDGVRIFYIEGGDSMLCDITGSGCMCSALMGAAVGASDPLSGALATCALFAVAGEQAAAFCRENGLGIGSFKVKLFDCLYALRDNDILERSRIYGG